MDSRDLEETPPARVGGLWQAARHRLVTYTFAPPWLTGRWAHPAFGYLVALLLQVSAVTGLTALTRLFPSFQFQEALVILVVLLVALTWGVGPSLLATMVGGALLVLFLLPPALSLGIARIEDALDLLVYLCVGCVVSLLTSQAQRARRSAERLRRRLDTIIEAIPDGLSIHNSAGRMVRLNPVAKQMFGVPAPGESGSSGEPFPDGSLAVARVLRGEIVTPVETHWCDPGGRDRYLVTNAAPFHDMEGGIEGVVLVWHDVSALKEAEALKDEFIGLVAHELRHPVAVLNGFAQTLLKDERGGDVRLTDWQREALQGIDQATFHLVRLTDELLDATRLQAGRLELARELTDLVALCRRVVARFQRTAHQQTLLFETPLDHLVAQVDPERIEQVVDNLLSNAIKYSPENGPVQVTLRELNEATMASLSVSDHGIGIPAQQQARIFGRFERADNSRAYGISGTGLGLYLSRALVEQHGGRIWFESVEGQGSTFFVELPLSS